MNRKSDFKGFNFIIKKDKILNDEHLVFIFKIQTKQLNNNLFAIPIIKKYNKDLSMYSFISQLTFKKYYPMK